MVYITTTGFCYYSVKVAINNMWVGGAMTHRTSPVGHHLLISDLLRWSHGFVLYSINKVYYIIWFFIQTKFCIPEINLAWSRYIILCVADVVLLILCKKFLCLFMRDMNMYKVHGLYFSLISLSGFGIKVILASLNGLGSIPPSWSLWKSLWKIYIISF